MDGISRNLTGKRKIFLEKSTPQILKEFPHIVK